MAAAKSSASRSAAARTGPSGGVPAVAEIPRPTPSCHLRCRHAGLRAAIEAVFIGLSWQRCRVHFLRNLLAQVPKRSAEMVAAAIRTIFA